MAQKIFVLLDSDSRYVERFLTFLRRKPGFPFQISGFTSWEECEKFLASRSPNACLIGEAFWDSMDEEQKMRIRKEGVYLRLLSASRAEGEEEPLRLYRYQSSEELVRFFLAGYEEEMPAGFSAKGGGTEFTAIYSPVRRCGKSVCALVLGQILAEREAVLAVTLDAFSAGWPGGENAGSFSDLLYFRSLAGGERVKLHSLTQNVGKLAVLPAAMTPEDIWALSAEETGEVLREIGAAGGFDEVVVDVGCGRDPLPVLSLCRRILVPIREDVVSSARMKEFFSYLERSGGEKTAAACRKVRIPNSPELRDGCGDFRQLRYSALGRFLEEEWDRWETDDGR